MEYRRLGRTGLKVSELCLGTMQWGWTADEATSFAVMDAFVAAGGNFIDTADVYSRWVQGNPGRRLRGDHRALDEGARQPPGHRAGDKGARSHVGRPQRRGAEPGTLDARSR